MARLTEPSPTELLHNASANLTSAKTAHLDGTGSFAISSELSFSFDFKLNGDVEMPDKSRLTTRMSLLGQSLSVVTITVDRRTFSKGLMGGIGPKRRSPTHRGRCSIRSGRPTSPQSPA